MKMLRYGAPGKEKPGLLDFTDTIHDLSAVIDDLAGAWLLPEGPDRLRGIDSQTLPEVAGVQRIGPCVGRIGKFICIGLNYADHAAESGLPVPGEPIVFNEWLSAVAGPNDDVKIPRGARKTDWEVELAVVIGNGGAYIDEAEALGHIAAYCVINDVSERECQIERGGTCDKGKGCDIVGPPLEPWLVAADEISDPRQLGLWLKVDGKRHQNGNTSAMIFEVPRIVSCLSRFMSVQPGTSFRRVRHRASALARTHRRSIWAPDSRRGQGSMVCVNNKYVPCRHRKPR
jgi:2-keto-4-pentenoate hydratase/2-oxohepta-3-ene-1,7-dioic acid hydratase in catechol pathway